MDVLAETARWHIATVLVEGEPVEEILPFEPVSKAKSAEIEKFERKKTGARAGVRHVS